MTRFHGLRSPHRFAAPTDTSGSFATLFALALVPLIGVAGAALDYSRANAVRAQAQVAVDGAALAGVQKLARSATEAEATAVSVFAQNAPQALRSTRPVIKITENETKLSVCATGTMETGLVRAIGFSSLPLAACSEAVRPSKQYIDIYLALDVSASMGLAADEAGRDRLRGLTGCAFACHEKEGGQTKSNFDVAKENGILTRVDVLRKATRDFADSLLNQRDPSNGLPRNEYRFAMFSISDDLRKLLNPPTPFQSRVHDEIDRIQLDMNTQFDVALPEIDKEMGEQMDGGDRSRPRKFLFLVTDGVQSKRGQPWGSSAFRPIDVRLCEMFKKRGFPVAVLNVRYVPMPTEAPYNGTVARFQSQLAPNLRACASDNLYFEAERPDEITRAFEKFSGALTAYRISR
jgi:Flp pilus assembly protein TadG